MKHAVALSLLLLCALPSSATSLVSHPTDIGQRNFSNAKRVLPTIYAGHEQDFYCGCAYSGRDVDLNSCNVEPRKQATRAGRMEWEHIVPAWAIGHQRQCWQAPIKGSPGGRRNCTKVDAIFGRAEGDLVNLVPSVGEINGDRSNYGFSAWTTNPTPMYGTCETVVDFKRRAVQPRPAVRGQIARIQFYMADTYGLKLSRQETQLFCAWAKQYPITDWEKLRDQRIVRRQGTGNVYVQSPEVIAQRCKR